MDRCQMDGMALGNKQIPGIREEGGAGWTAAVCKACSTTRESAFGGW